MEKHCSGLDAETEGRIAALASTRRRDWARHRRLFPASDGLELCRELLTGEGMTPSDDATQCLRARFVQFDRVISAEDDAKLAAVAAELRADGTLLAGADGYFGELEAKISERFDDEYLTGTRLHVLVGALSDYFVFGRRI